MDHTSENRKSESIHTDTSASFIDAIFSASLNSSSNESNRRMSDCAKLISCMGCGILHILVATRRHGGTSQSKSAVICSLCSGATPTGRVSSHDCITGLQPSSEGCTYTMPHRDTVAGDATARS